MTIRSNIRKNLRTFGWDISQFHPDISIDAYLTFLFKHLEINCVVDVGAHYGEYGLMLRDLGFKGHILSFEPVKANRERLASVTAGDPKWRIYPYALGRFTGQQTIHVARDSVFTSFLKKTDYGDAHFDDMQVEYPEIVHVRRLDDLFPAMIKTIPNAKVYLKLDTQGWDLEVLAGATDTIQNVIALQSELSLQPLYEGMPSWVEAIQTWKQHCLTISALFPVVRDEQLRLTEIDCVFVRDSTDAN